MTTAISEVETENLNVDESRRLVELDRKIERGLGTFIEVGEALMEIRASAAASLAPLRITAAASERAGFFFLLVNIRRLKLPTNPENEIVNMKHREPEYNIYSEKDGWKDLVSRGEWASWVKAASGAVGLSRSELKEWLQTEHGRQITEDASDVGGKILAICPEFVCIEKPERSRVVESTTEVDRALAIALFGISDAGNSDVRLALARALLGLAEHAAGQPIDRNELLDQLSGSLGKLVLSMLNTPPAPVRVGSTRKRALAKYSALAKSPADLAHSPREQRKKAELAVQDAVTAIRSALGALVHWKFPSPDKRSTQPDKINLVWLVQLTAKQIFREDLRRPRQTEIEAILKEDGYGFNGRGSAAKWREVFRLAGLDTLPR